MPHGQQDLSLRFVEILHEDAYLYVCIPQPPSSSQCNEYYPRKLHSYNDIYVIIIGIISFLYTHIVDNVNFQKNMIYYFFQYCFFFNNSRQLNIFTTYFVSCFFFFNFRFHFRQTPHVGSTLKVKTQITQHRLYLFRPILKSKLSINNKFLYYTNRC